MVLANVKALGGAVLLGRGESGRPPSDETTSQVNVKIYILEIDDTGLKQLGIDLQAATNNPSRRDRRSRSDPAIFPVVEGTVGLGRALTSGSFYRTTTLAPTLNLILTSGHAKILSAPDLVTLPGHKADFLVGGQIPIPVSTGPSKSRSTTKNTA